MGEGRPTRGFRRPPHRRSPSAGEPPLSARILAGRRMPTSARITCCRTCPPAPGNRRSPGTGGSQRPG